MPSTLMVVRTHRTWSIASTGRAGCAVERQVDGTALQFVI